MKFLDFNFQQQCFNELKTIYFEFIKDLREDVAENYENPYLSQFFQISLRKILLSKDLDQYSSIGFYWVFQIDRLISALQLIEDTKAGDSDASDDLILFWEESEYANLFLEKIKSQENLLEISQDLLKLLENQILSIYYVHLGEITEELSHPLPYLAISELGDFNQRLYIGRCSFIKLDKNLEDFPQLNLISVQKKESSIDFENDFEIHQHPIKKLSSYAHVDEFTLQLRPSCAEGLKTEKIHQENIEKALRIIKNYTPSLFQLFQTFTHTIVPINEPSIVSYSMETLPGFSCLNLFERDFIDLIDDLIHENGHHYMNSILSHKELLCEDDDKIYYSPWRRALRPVRGIYHAVFTFYWAYHLFKELSSQEIKDFNQEEKAKCLTRYIEETTMIHFCRPLIKHAYQNGKITPPGMDLINEILKAVDSSQEKLSKSLNQLLLLNKQHYQSCLELKKHLEKKGTHYRLS